MTHPSQPDYAAGQLWRCAGRTPDETPTVLINQVDQHPQGGKIYHVTLDGVRLKNPAAPGGVIRRLPHVPIIGQGLDASGATYVGEKATTPAFREGYAQWKAAFDAQQAGSFGVSVAQVLEIVERGMNSAPRQ